MSSTKSPFSRIALVGIWVCIWTASLGGCASPDHIVAQGVKDWCERDVHCGRRSSDPSQVPTSASPSRDNPSGAPQ